MAVKPIPEGYHSVNAYLMVEDAARELDFYQRAFGAKELYRLPMKDREGHEKIGHAEIMIGDTHVMLSDEWPEMAALVPNKRGGPTASFVIYVADVDAAWQRAVEAGAKPDRPVTNEFWGDRMGTVIDPFGHKWMLGTHVEDVAPEEMNRRVAQMASGPQAAA